MTTNTCSPKAAEMSLQIFDGQEAHLYDKIAAEMPFRYRRAHHIQNEALLISLTDLRHAHVLEIGCGTASDLLSLLIKSKAPFDYIGIDNSATMLKLASTKFDNYTKGSVEFLWANALADETWERLMLEHFDVIFSALTYHHFTDTDRFRLHARAKKLLAPGGRYILLDLYRYDEFALDAWAMETEVEDIVTTVERALHDQVDCNAAKYEWARHYREENKPPCLSSEVAHLRSLGFTVDILFRDVQVAVIQAS